MPEWGLQAPAPRSPPPPPHPVPAPLVPAAPASHLAQPAALASHLAQPEADAAHGRGRAAASAARAPLPAFEDLVNEHWAAATPAVGPPGGRSSAAPVVVLPPPGPPPPLPQRQVVTRPVAPMLDASPLPLPAPAPSLLPAPRAPTACALCKSKVRRRAMHVGLLVAQARCAGLLVAQARCAQAHTTSQCTQSVPAARTAPSAAVRAGSSAPLRDGGGGGGGGGDGGMHTPMGGGGGGGGGGLSVAHAAPVRPSSVGTSSGKSGHPLSASYAPADAFAACAAPPPPVVRATHSAGAAPRPTTATVPVGSRARGGGADAVLAAAKQMSGAAVGADTSSAAAALFRVSEQAASICLDPHGAAVDDRQRGESGRAVVRAATDDDHSSPTALKAPARLSAPADHVPGKPLRSDGVKI